MYYFLVQWIYIYISVYLIPPRVHQENHKIRYQLFVISQLAEDPDKKKIFLLPCTRKKNKTFFQVFSIVLWLVWDLQQMPQDPEKITVYKLKIWFKMAIIVNNIFIYNLKIGLPIIWTFTGS